MNESWITNSAEDANFDFLVPKPPPIPFDTEHFAPLNFNPVNEVVFAVKRARELLKHRTNEQCIAIARRISKMIFVIESLEREGEMSMVELAKPMDVLNSHGRRLFQWMDTFDTAGISCAEAEWFEVFAVKVLMLCVEVCRTIKLENEKSNLEFTISETRLIDLRKIQLNSDIVDCLARAEVLEKYSRVNSSAKILGKKGGKGRSIKLEPLEREVIRLYLADYVQFPVLKAANCIAAVLSVENPELLICTKSSKKQIAIQNIIIKLKAGKIKTAC